MLNNSFFLLLLLTTLLLFSCGQNQNSTTFSVHNPLALHRPQETISIPAERVKGLIDRFGAENLLIREEGGEEVLLSQAIDLDGDGEVDEILFQAELAASARKIFRIEGVEEARGLRPQTHRSTFSRFVPERTDDYAWENDRVAFRTYGPEAQRLTEAGEPGGTLSSGMDAWLKRVDYPIIDKWYANHQKEPGAYHIDTGEGYDPYHVGASRGLGGIGIWLEDSLWVSRNFTTYKTIATGPIRTIFELSYAPWQAGETTIRETKRISLDLGSNLSKFEVRLESDRPLPQPAIGLSLHEQQGQVQTNAAAGWFRYWEPMDGSELGVGLVMDPAGIVESLDHRVATKDQSHLLVLTKPSQPITYYAGFGWKKSKQFESPEAWDEYLARFAQRLRAPLVVEF